MRKQHPTFGRHDQWSPYGGAGAEAQSAAISPIIQERTSPIVHRRPGARRRSRPLIGVLRHGSDCDLLGDFDSIIDLDAKMANRTLDLEWQTQST
jgi:hypothetical protein